MRRKPPSVFVLVGIVLALGCNFTQAEQPVIRWQGRTMGSPYTVQIVGINLSPEEIDGLQAEVEKRLREVNRQTF